MNTCKRCKKSTLFPQHRQCQCGDTRATFCKDCVYLVDMQEGYVRSPEGKLERFCCKSCESKIAFYEE